ncbi:MAG: hypothetical protein R2751_02580 [Bacteroidales bacterium]
MKELVRLPGKLASLLAVLCFVFAPAFADGEGSEIFLKGSSHSPAGDFTVLTTDDVFHFQGKEYEIYSVYYEDPGMNMKIAVNTEGPCRSFVAITEDYMFFYMCNQDGFGVRKVMFSNPWSKEEFAPARFQEQTVLVKTRKVDKKQAVGLIASYVPRLKA